MVLVSSVEKVGLKLYYGSEGKKVSDDPFEQMAYAYSLIESEVDMGRTE